LVIPLRLPLSRQLVQDASLRSGVLVSLAAAVALAASLRYVTTPDGGIHPTFDDSFITLTFARNLAEHGKLTFDGESWSTGATSILHVVALAVPIKLGVEPIRASIGVGIVSHVLLTMAVFWLGWAVFRSLVAGFAGASIVAFNHWAAFDSGGGLETGLFMALVAATFASYLSFDAWRGRLLTGGLAALAILTRPEGAFLLPASLVYEWLRREPGEPLPSFGRKAALLAGPGVGVLAALSLFALAVTGSFTPGTATAKMHFFQEYDFFFRDKITIMGEQVGQFLGSMLPVVILAAVAANRREALLFGLFWLPVLVMYVLVFPGGLGHYFFRYQHPVVPLLAALAGGGAWILLRAAMDNGYVAKALVAAAFLVLAVPAWQQYENWRSTYGGAVFDLRGIEAMAQDLNNIVRPDETLAAHDIGAVGYYGRFRVLDIVGLVNPDVIKYNRNRTLNRYLQGRQPQYLLTFEDWDDFFLRLGARFHPETYELVKRYTHGPGEEAPYYLYRIHYPLPD